MTARRIRVLVAKAGLDGHDRGARVVASALRDAGCEVIYSGLRATIPQIAAAALQEDVDVVGLSILSGAHESICQRLIAELEERGARIPILVGGIVPDADRERLLAMGVRAVFGPEAPLEEIVSKVQDIAAGEGDKPQATPAPFPGRAELEALDHVAICVANLDEAIPVFEKLLGRKCAHRELVEAQKTEAAFFDMPNGASLELIAPKGGNAGLEKFLQKRGPGLHHVALQVDGIDQGLAAMRAQGLEAIDQQPRPGARGHRVAFLHPRTAGGVLVELVEHGEEKK
jgi:methylmalonyl-CoA mutase C-terminal domain/subunit